jgi:hypothetical protein
VSEREREQIVRERERESCCLEEERREEENAVSGKAPSSRHQRLRSTIIRGPIELKFCRKVHNTWISIVNGGDRIWSNLHSFIAREQ